MACRSPCHDFSDGWGFFSRSLANPPIGKKPIKGWAPASLSILEVGVRTTCLASLLEVVNGIE